MPLQLSQLGQRVAQREADVDGQHPGIAVLGQVRESLESLLAGGRCLAEGGALHGSDGGVTEIGHSALRVLGTRKMQGEGGGHTRGLGPIPRFGTQANAPMQSHALPGRHPPIDHIMIQGMAKTIAGGHGAIRPRLRPLSADEPPLPGPGRTARVDGLFGLRHARGDGRRGEGAARDTGRVEEGLLVRRKLLELLLDEPPQTLWDEPGDGLPAPVQAPAVVAVRKQLLRHELLDHCQQK
jgi:hypothetical protein